MSPKPKVQSSKKQKQTQKQKQGPKKMADAPLPQIICITEKQQSERQLLPIECTRGCMECIHECIHDSNHNCSCHINKSSSKISSSRSISSISSSDSNSSESNSSSSNTSTEVYEAFAQGDFRAGMQALADQARSRFEHFLHCPPAECAHAIAQALAARNVAKGTAKGGTQGELTDDLQAIRLRLILEAERFNELLQKKKGLGAQCALIQSQIDKIAPTMRDLGVALEARRKEADAATTAYKAACAACSEQVFLLGGGCAATQKK